LREVREKLGLAAEEMRHAGDVEPKSVLFVGVESRAIMNAESRECA
jgi:hypothetical protein